MFCRRTTPGYPSKPGVPRQPVDGAIPSIPSIPISYVDAIPILKSLNGYGPRAKDLNKWWTRSLGLEYKGVEYNIGPSPENLVLNLVNEQEYVTTPLWDVIGIINGTLQEEVIVVGNHRDAWVAGGAGDPNSGSAALNEVIRGFGKAVKMGWKPLRTIVFASWDGEEYGLVGSTEWVEEYLSWLTDANVAYVNMDIGCAGPEFRVSSSPLLHNIIYEVTGLVLSPNQTVDGQTVRDVWSGHITTMGSGSDFTAFQDFAGIPSIDMGFSYSAKNPVYHYHSNYDSFYWISTYGDPGFLYHAAAARILGLFVAKLVETPVIPLNTTDYANALKEYIAKVKSKLEDSAALSTEEEEEAEQEARFRPVSEPTTGESDVSSLREMLTRLDRAAAALQQTAGKFDSHAAALADEVANIPWWRWFNKWQLYRKVQAVNQKLKMLERQFLYPNGLDGRSWFKHIVFAPGLWTGYAGGEFSYSISLPFVFFFLW
jgi:N-acetylated-alpha-linked acidic dipeptidase